jgi:LysR family hydrogen peroxide-inducible transcriptional activator
MNIRDLTYLVAVAKHRHFGRAAEECFVSQPALSMQLKKLEEELGVVLFERTNKRVMITSVGQDMVDRAAHILEMTADMKEAAARAHDPFGGRVKFGAFPTIAPYILPQIVPDITDEHPNLQMLLVEEKTDALIAQLKAGELDVAMLALPIVDEPMLMSAFVFDDPFYLAVSKHHEFATRKKLSRDELASLPLLLLEEGHCLRAQALDVCLLAGANEHQDFRATSLETLRQMVASNVGVTLIPGSAKKENDELVYIPFSAPVPSRSIGLVWRKSTVRRELIESMVKIVSGE